MLKHWRDASTDEVRKADAILLIEQSTQRWRTVVFVPRVPPLTKRGQPAHTISGELSLACDYSDFDMAEATLRGRRRET